MKVFEVRELSNEQAFEKLRELKTEIARERALQSSGTRPENPGRIRAIRRTIARILTIVHQRGPTAEAGTDQVLAAPQVQAEKKEKHAVVEKGKEKTADKVHAKTSAKAHAKTATHTTAKTAAKKDTHKEKLKSEKKTEKKR